MIFICCTCYPDCDYAVWNQPLNEPCPQCKWPMLTVKQTKKRGIEKVCPQKDCDFAEPGDESLLPAESNTEAE